MRCFVSCLALAFALPACDAPDGPAPLPHREGAVEAAIAASQELPSALQNEARTSARIAAEAVLLSTELADAGQRVTTGTLVQDDAGFTWAPQPTDRLVVEFGDGTDFHVWVDDMAGDDTSATAFLEGDHRFVYRVAVADRLDVAFSSAREAGTLTATAVGTYVHEGVDYDVALDLSGLDRRQITGSILADDFDLDVDETWPSRADASQRTISSSLRLGDDVYDWVDGEILHNGSSWATAR
jgi:hypothetical protein